MFNLVVVLVVLLVVVSVVVLTVMPIVVLVRLSCWLFLPLFVVPVLLVVAAVACRAGIPVARHAGIPAACVCRPSPAGYNLICCTCAVSPPSRTQSWPEA